MSSIFTKDLGFRFILPALVCVIIVSTPVDLMPQDSTSTASSAEPAVDNTPMAPVVVDGITLFSVRGVSAYPADKRAEAISTQIVAAAANRAVSKDSLQLLEAPNSTVILAGNHRIMQVIDADAVLEGVNRKVLAQIFQSRIAKAIDAYRQDRAPALLARHVLYALAVLVTFVIGIFVGRRVARRGHSILETRCRNRLRGVGIQSFHIIRPEQEWRILTGFENFFWAALLLTVGYLCLYFVLSLFPWTRGLANDLFSMLVKPLETIVGGMLRLIPNLVFLAILGLTTRYVLTLIRLFFASIESGTITLKEFDPGWAQPTYRLVRVAVIACAVVVAYPYIPGSETEAFKAVSLFIGVLVSLGSTSLIGNIIAGYTLTYRRTFKAGDRIKIGDYMGDVEQSRVLATYLRTPKNELLVVPNSKIINEEVVNYSALARREGLILHTAVGIGYDAPWRQVEAMLLEAAARSPGVLREPKPFVLQKMLGDFAVTYELNAYCDQPQAMGRVYTQLHQNILDLFNEYGVQIMTPAYEGDPERIKVVPPNQWYAAPARQSDGQESFDPKSSAVSRDPDVPPIPKAS
jgi:small-conductance mechanosensitive channel